MKSRRGVDDAAIGRVLRRLRLKAGMTQIDLGEKIDVSYQQVQKYEIGANRVALSTCLRIARALDMRPRDFVAMVEAEIQLVIVEGS